MTRRTRSFLSSLVVLALLPAVVAAQQIGIITGRVTTEGGQPVADARLRISGTTIAAVSGADGTYRLTGAPAGAQQLRLVRLGYAAQTKPVTVVAGQSAEVNFSLAEAVTTLDQVVVTATGQTERRRESGVSVGTIDSAMVNLATTPLLSNILSSRIPGVTVQQASGTTGVGSRVRIRGSNSINLSNEPLLIVDGTRVGNSPNSGSFGVGGQVISRLEDFNPQDIESIDVVKGPAAAALYGTAAANGVIQITTKRGRAGRTRWSGYEEFGTIKDVFEYPANYNRIGTTLSTGINSQGCTLEREVLRVCAPFASPDSLRSWNPIENVSPFREGFRQLHGLSASGGGQATTYYVSGEYEREQGIYEPNKLGRVSGRTNVRTQLRDDLDATITFGVVRYRLRLPNNDNSAFGAISAGFLGKAFDCSPTTFATNVYCGSDSLSRGYFNANIPSTQYYNITNDQQNDRLTANIQSNWSPRSWLRGVGLMGMDVLNRNDNSLTPPGKVFFSASTLEGSRGQSRTRQPTYNLQGSLIANYAIPNLKDWKGQTTAGGQYIREDFRQTTAQGAVLLPGTSSLNGTSARFSVNETNQEVITFGTFAQQQASFADRLFLTTSVRLDRSSAFGTNFKTVPYPSANASYVISDESFFPKTSFIDQVRVRAGWGKSGQRPVFRDAATYFSPVSMQVSGVESPAITVGGTGNADLKPEVSTETEAGLEASLFNSRVNVEVTGYTKTTDDALVSKRLAPSLGVTATQLVNLGQVKNKGIEGLATVKILDMADVDLSTTVTVTANRNQLVSLGLDALGKPLPPIFFGFSSTQEFRNGYPLGGYFQRKITSFADLDGNGILTRINCPAYAGTANPAMPNGPQCELQLSDSLEYIGSPIPTRESSFNTSLGLFKYARVSALLDYRGGYRIFNSTTEFRCTLGTPNCKDVYDKSLPLDQQARVVARLMGGYVGFIEDASFVKFRELALTLTAPKQWATRAKVDGVSLTIAGRNLHTWTDYTGLDPEVNANAGSNFTTSDFLTQPPVRYFVTRLSLQF